MAVKFHPNQGYAEVSESNASYPIRVPLLFAARGVFFLFTNVILVQMNTWVVWPKREKNGSRKPLTNPRRSWNTLTLWLCVMNAVVYAMCFFS